MAKVMVDISGIKAKLGSGNMARAKFAMANQMLNDMQPFVPNDVGVLQQTGHVEANGDYLKWGTPYGNAQFRGTNGIVVFRHYTTPGTGKRWDLKAKGLYMNDWKNVFVRGLNL